MVAVNGDMECRYTVNDTDRCRYTVNDTVRGRYPVNDTLHYSTDNTVQSITSTVCCLSYRSSVLIAWVELLQRKKCLSFMYLCNVCVYDEVHSMLHPSKISFPACTEMKEMSPIRNDSFKNLDNKFV